MGLYDDSLGAFLVGVILGAFFLGVACLQSITYYTTYGKDPWFIKFAVAICLACNIGHQIGITHKMYINTVTNYGNIAILADVGWGLIAHVYFTAFTAITVQMFYFYRIWILLNKKHLWLAVFLGCASVAQFIMAFMYSVKASTISTTELPTLTGLVSGVNGISAGLDIVISAIMCWIFSSKRTGFKKTDTILIKLVAYVISSGFLTSVCALGTFIAFKASPATFIAYPFNFLISRMYIVALLATLNSRISLRMSARDHTDEFDLSLPTTNSSAGGRPAPRVLVSIEHHGDSYQQSPSGKFESNSIEDSVDRK